MTEATLAIKADAELGEGPSWFTAMGKLIWVDITAGLVHLSDIESGETITFDAGRHVGAATATRDGDILLAARDGFYRMNATTGESIRIGPDIDYSPEEIRLNDAKCDPRGRFFAGTMGYQCPPGVARLYRLDTNLTLTTLLDGVTISNGLAWNSAGDTFYYIDTPTKRVDAFDYDIETGDIANRRTVITIEDGMGNPDGMTIDVEDKLWIAHWGGWCVTRWDPATGECLEKVRVPAERVTCPAFGGADLGTLFITTSGGGLSAEARAQQPDAGSVFSFHPDVPGVTPVPFEG